MIACITCLSNPFVIGFVIAYILLLDNTKKSNPNNILLRINL